MLLSPGQAALTGPLPLGLPLPLLSAPAGRPCAADYPLSPVVQIEELQPGQHPIPGLQHITLFGQAHFGAKGLEVGAGAWGQEYTLGWGSE